ncbi:MAG TPA: FAD-dependent oxidoreductase, partial [Devosiaceae bacterium]|nr:FAD-dependent oxidoreductase [Devosiaceae bacterium]
MAHQYDLIVIGGGSAGVRAARMSAQYGARVALVEESRMGGTCVIRGCVPKKLFAYASRFPALFDVAPSYGWSVEASFSWPTLLANKNAEIARLEASYESVLADAGVTALKDRAALSGPQTVKLETGGTELSSERILIATGGHPVRPGIEGAELAITSNEALELETLPSSILIVGGGYVAAEFASIFHGLGVKVTVSYRRDLILRGFDQDLREGISTAMTDSGVTILANSQPSALAQVAGGIQVSFEHGAPRTYGAVMFATGRVPNTAELGLDRVGVMRNARAAVEVDEWSQTSVQSVFAVGDV